MKKADRTVSLFYYLRAAKKIRMKKYAFSVIFLTICLLLSNLYGYSQRFIGYAAAGANFGQIEGDDVHGFTKIGANAGLGLKLPVNRAQTMSVTAELLYVQKGAYKHHFVDTLYYHASMFDDVDRSEPFKTFSKCNISLDYVQIPVMFNYEDVRTGFTFGLGFSWSRLVRAKEIYNGFRRTTTIRSGTYNTSDWSVLANVDIRLYKNLSLGLRWEFSMVPIRTMHFLCGSYNADGTFNVKRDEYNKMRNHVLSLRLCYYFNEQFERNTKTDKNGNLIGTKWIRVIPEYE